jgi:hypothetical protein
LTCAEFEKVKIGETLESREGRSYRAVHSRPWQADRDKIRRMAPIEFNGRCMPGWFDFAICDEIHQLDGIRPKAMLSELCRPVVWGRDCGLYQFEGDSQSNHLLTEARAMVVRDSLVKNLKFEDTKIKTIGLENLTKRRRAGALKF